MRYDTFCPVPKVKKYKNTGLVHRLRIVEGGGAAAKLVPWRHQLREAPVLANDSHENSRVSSLFYGIKI